MKRVALGIVALIAMLAVCIVTSAPAKADNLSVQLSNGGSTVTCADGAGCDTNALAGAVTFTSTLGTVTISLQGTGSGQPALTGLNMDLAYNVTNNSAAPAGTFTIQVSENNLSGSGVGWSALVNGNQDSGMSTAFNSWADTSDVLFGHGGPLCGTGGSPITTTSVAFSCNSAGGFSSQSFSLTEQITIVSPSGSHNASGDAKLTASTPEPGSIMLLGSGLLGLAGLIRRKLNA